jgi:hypothetical protein
MGIRQVAASQLRDLPIGVHKLAPPALRRSLRHGLGRYYAWENAFDFHNTPILEPGEVDGPPEFVGIGVQKAGTTWWFDLIIGHPGVSHLLSTDRQRQFSGPIHKERHFFARFAAEEFGPSYISDYRKWFPRRTGTITGEWTPDYLYYPWAPALLAQAAPEAKLLLILRDPVQRFVSGVAAATRNGAEHIGATFAEALGHSMYARNIGRWFDHFPAEQVLVLQYERCVAAPADELARTYRFLRLDDQFQPKEISRPINKTVEQKLKLANDAQRRLSDLFAPDVAELAKLVPSLDLSLWETGCE